MSNALYELLTNYRKHATGPRELGTYFELLIQDYLKNDPVFTPQFSEVYTYSEWAETQGLRKTDTGIDLVAKRRDGKGFCAIQCKFYDEHEIIQKKYIDSFFTASGKKPFTQGLIIDTTRNNWSKNAEDALINRLIPTQRIGLSDLENSAIDWGKYRKPGKINLKRKNELRDYQQKALDQVVAGFVTKMTTWITIKVAAGGHSLVMI